MQVAALPRREELETLARYYHHLENEHKRAAPESGMRRRIEEKQLYVRERFERLLEEWVPEPDLRDEWRAYLHHRGPVPSGPPAIRRLAFRGVNEAGSLVEISGSEEELRVEVDGALIERIAGKDYFVADAPAVRFRLERNDLQETFEASDEALQALADFHENGGSPPWEYASELLADGLIDVHFDLTARGRRALAR